MLVRIVVIAIASVVVNVIGFVRIVGFLAGRIYIIPLVCLVLFFLCCLLVVVGCLCCLLFISPFFRRPKQLVDTYLHILVDSLTCNCYMPVLVF